MTRIVKWFFIILFLPILIPLILIKIIFSGLCYAIIEIEDFNEKMERKFWWW